MAFPIAKALHKQGVRVYSGVSTASNYLEWSRFLSGSFQHPSTDLGTDEALPFFLNWLDQHRDIDAIQPVSESTSRMISRHRDTFERHAALIMPAPQTLETCYNKAEMFRLCTDLDVPLAPYAIVRSKQDLMTATERIGFPLIVKPSTVDAELFGRKAVIAHASEALEAVFTDWPDLHPELIVQQYVSGPRHSVIFSATNGRLLKAAQAAALRTHEDDGTGYTTLGETVTAHPVVKEATEKLVRHLNYSSTGCAQFIIDPKTDRITFMELNPRTSLARVAEMAGVDHSITGLKLALGERMVPLTDPWTTKIGVRYAWTKGDLMRIKRGMRSGDKSLASALVDIYRVGADALRAHHAIFDPVDPMPAIGTYSHFALKRFRRRTHQWLTDPSLAIG
ncbi:MAG: hypothetical protein AAFV37_09160 [Pseudomonadota bacterium]